MKSKSDSPATEVLTKKLLFECNNQLLYQIDLDSTETLSQETFIDLINVHKSTNKSLILAVVRSRDLEQLNQFYQFFFNAFHLNKLMFRKKNNNLIGRHDKTRPFSVTNPLTNTQIIGEVEYFLINNIETPEENIKAELIGTDFTYISSEKLRKIFEDNALKPEDVKYAEFAEPNDLNFADFQVPEFNVDHILREIEENKEELQTEIRVPFKNAFILGGITVIYIIIIYAIVSVAGKKFFAGYNGTIDRYNSNEIVQIVCLPIICFLYDKYIFTLFKEIEERPIIHAKIISWVCLGGAIGLSFTTNSLIIMISCSGMLFGYAIYYYLFSLANLFNKYSKKPLI